MIAITGLFGLLLAIAVVGDRKYEDNPMRHNKISSLISKLDEVDNVSDQSINRRYQLMYIAEAWLDAKETCELKGGKLATPKTMYEFKVIQRLVRRMRYQEIKNATGTKHLAWVGISSLEDWTKWRTVDGDDIRTTGFSMWVRGSGTISPDPKQPHCAGVDAVNLLRDYWCDRRQPYVCEFKYLADDCDDLTYG